MMGLPAALFRSRWAATMRLPRRHRINPPMLRRVLLLASIALFAAGGPARAEGVAAPFDGSLQRLAEILGALLSARPLRRQ